MSQRCCTRIYPNGSVVIDMRDESATLIWVEHNARLRPECALFVAGELSSPGYFTESEALRLYNLAQKG